MDTPGLPSLADISLKKPDKVILGVLSAVLLALAGGAVYALILVMPLLVELAKDSLIFFALLLAMAALGVGVLQLWMARKSYLLKMKMIAKNIRRRVITSDPLGAIDVAIASLGEKFVQADAEYTKSDAALKTLARQIRNDDRRAPGALDEAEHEAQLAKLAERDLGKGAADAHYARSQSWLDTGNSLQALYDGQKRRQARILDAKQVAQNGLESLKIARRQTAMKLDALKADAAQARSFRAIFGGGEELDTIDMAVEVVERQSAQYEAEIEAMLRQAEPAMERSRLQTTADAETARARLGAATETVPVVTQVRDGVLVDGGKR